MPKKRKPRKPMSKEQKAAAAERLKKARAVRAEKKLCIRNYGNIFKIGLSINSDWLH